MALSRRVQEGSGQPGPSTAAMPRLDACEEDPALLVDLTSDTEPAGPGREALEDQQTALQGKKRTVCVRNEWLPEDGLGMSCESMSAPEGGLSLKCEKHHAQQRHCGSMMVLIISSSFCRILAHKSCHVGGMNILAWSATPSRSCIALNRADTHTYTLPLTLTITLFLSLSLAFSLPSWPSVASVAVAVCLPCEGNQMPNPKSAPK
jgi:hypothetical protein